MKIRAVVLRAMGAPRPYAQSRPMTVETLDLDPPGEGEVLVKVRAAGICHSDLSAINGDRPRALPMAVGHEAAGSVEEVGPGVGDLKRGDPVVMVFVPSCGHCLPCAEGRPALCEPGAKANVAGTLLGGARRIKDAAGKPLNHHIGVSGFAEYAVLSRRSLVKVPDDLAFEDAALFGCGVLTGVGAAVNTAKVQPGASVAVVGMGGVGLNAMLGAVACGATTVVAVDLLDEKLALARQLGATHTVNARDPDAAAQVKAITGGGAEVALEMAGSVPALELAYAITRRGGKTVTAGLANPAHKLSIQAASLVAEERTLMGSYIGSCVPSRDVPRFVRMFQQGKLPIDRLKSGTVTLDQVNEAFDRLADGVVVRQVLVP